MHIFFPLSLYAMEEDDGLLHLLGRLGVSEGCSQAEVKTFSDTITSLVRDIEAIELMTNKVLLNANKERTEFPVEDRLTVLLSEESQVISTIYDEYIQVLRGLSSSHPGLIRQEHNGITPLTYAANIGFSELLEWLLVNGADSYNKDQKGLTAMDVAYENYLCVKKNSPGYLSSTRYLGNFEQCVIVLIKHMDVSFVLRLFSDVTDRVYMKRRSRLLKIVTDMSTSVPYIDD